jgi:hypothetical protein
MPVFAEPLAWGFLIGLVATFAAILAWRKLVGRRVPGYIAHTEYWVYTPREELPKQELWMDRMISNNPHNRRGKPSIGAREGLLFSDIRLHIAVAKRSRNPLVFRPDLFEENAVPSKEVLERLSQANSLIKVRYLSEAVLKDTRHLQFMPHLADAMSDLSEGLIVYDAVCEQIFTAEEFTAQLEKNNNAERPDMHVRVEWKVEEDGGGHAYTKGLRKVGLPELRTDAVEPDQEVLITGLLHRAAHSLMRDPTTEDPFEYEEFGDTFILQRTQRSGEFVQVTIKRRRGE